MNRSIGYFLYLSPVYKMWSGSDTTKYIKVADQLQQVYYSVSLAVQETLLGFNSTLKEKNKEQL